MKLATEQISKVHKNKFKKIKFLLSTYDLNEAML